jgi:single stranded DNA-binding protein
MSYNLNRVTVTGYLARDPVLLGMPSGHSVCKLHVACNRKWQNKLTGAWVKRADFFDVWVLGPLAPTTHKSLRTGSGVAVDGRLYGQRTHCNHPEHRHEVVIIAEEIQFITANRPPVTVNVEETPMADEDELYAIEAASMSMEPTSSLNN